MSHLVTVKNEDAAMLMYANRKIKDRFLVVDVDPYGSCADFIDSAVQSVADGGLLMVTCTDMAILCGNHSETAFAKYGGSSLRLVSCHEQALRLGKLDWMENETAYSLVTRILSHLNFLSFFLSPSPGSS